MPYFRTHVAGTRPKVDDVQSKVMPNPGSSAPTDHCVVHQFLFKSTPLCVKTVVMGVGVGFAITKSIRSWFRFANKCFQLRDRNSWCSLCSSSRMPPSVHNVDDDCASCVLGNIGRKIEPGLRGRWAVPHEPCAKYDGGYASKS